MPYKRPGVFVEETLKPLSVTLSDPGEAEGAFVGTAPQGPIEPTRITSWSNYVTTYGGFGDGKNLLPFAVFQFFNNGGHSAWITRAVIGAGGGNTAAATASINLVDRTGLTPTTNGTFTTSTTGGVLAATTSYSYQVTATNAAGESLPSTVTSITTGAGSTNTVTLNWAPVTGATGYKIYGRTGTRGLIATVAAVTTWTDTGSVAPAAAVPAVDTSGTATLSATAISPGVWGSSVNISITPVTITNTPGRFNLLVYLGGTTDAQIVERYLDVSLDPADGRYVVNLVNSPYTGSSYIKLTDVPGSDTYDVTKAPALVNNISLAGGTEGTGTADLAAATYKLESVTSNLVLNLPGVNDGITLNPIISWAEAQGNVFLVVDGPPAAPGATADATATAYVTAAAGLTPPSSYVAVYGPWLRVDDPAGRVAGSMRLLPPGGAVMGQYIRTDASRGVQKPPAGLETTLRGVLDVETKWLGSNLDTLNERGINVIRQVPGAGICIMGARTLKAGMPDRYVSIRRALMYIRKSLVDDTRFAIFESNNSALWEELSAVVKQFLTGLLQAGVLSGDTPEQAFFVKCDGENNTPSQVASGTVIIEVGVALAAPAEFIVIRIGQFEGGTAATEISQAA